MTESNDYGYVEAELGQSWVPDAGASIADLADGLDLDDLMADVAEISSRPRATTSVGDSVALTEEEVRLAASAAETAGDALMTAEGLRVEDEKGAALAAEFLSRLAGAKKRTEEARTTLVKPLNDHVKMINERFRPTREAWEAADRIVRGKLLTFRAEQKALAAASAPEESRAVAAPLSVPGGRVVEKKRWVAEIEDEEKVPREYLMVDMTMINAAVKSGVREIPGVRIFQKDELAVRAR